MSWRVRAVGIAATVLTAGGMMLTAAPAASATPAHSTRDDGGVSGYWWCTGAPNCQYNLCAKPLGCGSMPIYTIGPGEPVWAALPGGKSVVLNYSGWYTKPGDSGLGNDDWYDEGGSGGGGNCQALSKDHPCYQQE